MLMLPQRAFGRAIVRASPVFERWAEISELARTLALP
jgi:hypothetical protein